MKPLILAVDTSGTGCSCAIGEAGLVTAADYAEIGRGHAEFLPGQVDRLMQQTGHHAKDLTGLAVTTGPGSFTGVRVGIAYIRALALAHALPVAGLSSLAQIARAAARRHRHSGDGLAVIDAGRGACFALDFCADNGAVTSTAGEQQLPWPTGEKAGLICGPAAERINAGRPIDPKGPDAKDLLHDLRDTDFTGTAPTPLYLRQPDAKRPQRTTQLNHAGV